MKQIVKAQGNRILIMACLDVISVMIASFLSLYVRFDLNYSLIPPEYLEKVFSILGINIVITLFVFWIWKLYKSVWRYASANELMNIIGAVFVCTVAQVVILMIQGKAVPRSYYFFYGFILLVCSCGIRFSYRMLRILNTKRMQLINGRQQVNAMIVGAGAAGNAILKEIESSSYVNIHVCCMIDDHTGCHGKLLRGVPIVGGRESIKDAVLKYGVDEIIVAIPSASRKEIRDILEICKDTDCKLRMLPGIYQLINGEVNVSKLREVQIEDLLGRDPIQVNVQDIAGYVQNKTVMVTGGGGSIGSELCRQIAAHNPKQLIIVDIYENNAYEIQQELIHKYSFLELKVLIASVRNTNRMNAIFEQYRPQIVYHTAAHKHVPLMEDSPNEAVKNNVFGTYKTVMAADKYGVEKFVLISTDKAVNPTNIMGASKRICEMIIQMMNNKSRTDYVAVRFGNVLGSNGSVIPLFKKQIEQGGPVTVTHPDIVRYFMTIPEAVALVLQAGAYAKGGEIFVFDMGEPVKIAELAKNLIRLSGYKVDEDISIQYTGLRSGEKMYEELLMEEEGLKKTENSMIYIGRPIEFDEEELESNLSILQEAANRDDPDIKKLVKKMVSTYEYQE